MAWPLRAQEVSRGGVDSLLRAGRFAQAEALARTTASRDPQSAHGWLNLGRTILAAPTSRDRALRALLALRQATELAPSDVEAWIETARAAFALGGADGERLASDAIARSLAIAPQHQEAWERWLLLYRGRAQRERMRRILSPSDSIPEVSARIARLYMEDERYPEARATLTRALAADPAQPDWLALAAQLEFEDGQDSVGWAFYRSALREAARGGTLLWAQVVGIADPDEVRAWPGVSPAERRAFLERFWAARDPDLFAHSNARVGEHFRRFREARRRFPLLHPLSRYHRSASGRGSELDPSIAEQLYYQRCEAREMSQSAVDAYDESRSMASDDFGGFRWNPLFTREEVDRGLSRPGVLWLDPERVRLVSIPHSRDLRAIDTTAARVGYNLATGLDDRGVLLLRWGSPRALVMGSRNAEDPFCATTALERWGYGSSVGWVRFFRPNAISAGGQAGVRTTGDMVFRPMGRGQFEATALALTTDSSSVPGTLAFGFWAAQFAGNGGRSDLVVVVDRGMVATRAIGPESGPVAASLDGVASLSLSGGPYHLQVHARAADSLGRQSVPITVRGFEQRPAMSDLLLAHAWAADIVTRSTMLEHVSRGLSFRSGSIVRAMAEIYRAPGSGGRLKYATRYQLKRTSDPQADLQRDSLDDATTFAFQRETEGGQGTVVEWLDLTTTSLAPGRYLLRLETRNEDGRRIGRAQIVFRITM